MLTLETLYYPEDVRLRDQEEIVERLEGVEVSDDELAMAEQLVEGLAKPFEPEAYPNETRKALLEFLQAKAEGQEIAEPRGGAGAGAGHRPDGGAEGQPRRRRRRGGRRGRGDEDEAPGQKKPRRRGKKEPTTSSTSSQSRLRKVRGRRREARAQGGGEEAGRERRKAS